MHVDNKQEDDDELAMAVEIFRILSDATRLALLRELGPDHERTVNELAVAVGKRASGVSQHLAKLRMARLVTTRRSGTQIHYRVANEHVSQLVSDALRHTEHLGAGVPAHHR